MTSIVGAVLIAFGLGLWLGWAIRSKGAEMERWQQEEDLEDEDL